MSFNVKVFIVFEWARLAILDVENLVYVTADRLKNLKVEVGNSDTTMKLCGERAESPAPGEELTFICPDGMTGQYVKVSMNNQNFLTLCEVRVSAI